MGNLYSKHPVLHSDDDFLFFHSDLATHFHGHTLDLSLPQNVSLGSHLTPTCHSSTTTSFSTCFYYSSTSWRPLVHLPLHLLHLYFLPNSLTHHCHFNLFLANTPGSLALSFHNNTPILNKPSHSFTFPCPFQSGIFPIIQICFCISNLREFSLNSTFSSIASFTVKSLRKLVYTCLLHFFTSYVLFDYILFGFHPNSPPECALLRLSITFMLSDLIDTF